ncbi:MAG: adenylate/guanylate cyclase domain-containing protein [Anaerolineales bacterium]|nr:adenylate/guanylate cyclase domain-containing protein [Anaerolineales bacterium]
MNNLPSGTVTFLFTDIEGSTKLAQQYPDAMPALLARHNEILNQAIEAHNGFVFRVVGDSFSASFHSANDALNAALNAQRRLHNEAWLPAPIKVRMGIHIGAAQVDVNSTQNTYSGYATLALTQRIMSAGHGGQILLSQSTYDLTRDRLPEKAQLVDMGEHRLKDVLRPEHLYQLSVPDLPSEFAPLNTLEYFQHNIPSQLTSFVGREKEIVEIKALLNSSRLVTLTGSGGTGKTRLSIEVGIQELASFTNGVWLIELAPLTDHAQIIPALAQAFGLQELPFRPLVSQVMDYLRDKKLLLILDNCEHLIETCARLANDLLHQCAGLKILASSREALGIAGEVAYRTPSLADSESTRLFVERAQAANSKFSLTDYSNASAVAQICSRLDGIPLAIELAAARTKLLSADQIAARLDDLFRLLVGGSRTALPRQQTLRALIDWSYDLLTEEEKQLLRTASVFVGGWTLDALEAVSDDPNAIEHLEGLVNKSLVVTEERGSEMRYFMLETIRQYAREKLFGAKQSSAARDQHFVYFDKVSEPMWDAFRLENLSAMVKRAKDEVENFRAALEWGMENHVEESLRLAANFCIVSNMLGFVTEGVRIAQAAVERAKSLSTVSGDADLRRQKLIAKALFIQGLMGMGTGNMPLVLQVLREAIAISRITGDRQILGYSLEMYYTATGFIHMPDRDEAAREGFHIFSHEINDSFGLGMAQMNMARLAAEKGDESEKEMYFEQLRERIRESPESFQAGMFFLGMGMDEKVRGNHATAKKHFEDGLIIFKGLSNLNFQLAMRSEIGHVERNAGNFHQARLIYSETIKDWQELGNRGAIANQLECFAFLAIADEEPQHAVKLFSAAEALREKAQSPMADYERVEYDQSVAQMRAMLPEAEFNSLWAEGKSMTMEQAIELVLEATRE